KHRAGARTYRPPAEPAEPAAEVDHVVAAHRRQHPAQRRPLGSAVQPLARAAELAVGGEERRVVVNVLGHARGLAGAYTRMFTIEPGGGRRSAARASAAAAARVACNGVAAGEARAGSGTGAVAAAGFPASAASKKAFCAASRASLRPGRTLAACTLVCALVVAGGQTG